MWLMLQQETPDDYVLATGVSHSVRELVNYVFTRLGLHWSQYVKQDDKFQRAEELHFLKGDASKAKEKLRWEPTYTFETMLDEMIEYWIKTLTLKNI